MDNIMDKPSVFCYGEVLWDIFPKGARAGGAPFNVAYNLMRMGVDAHMLSRVGNDKLGKDLLAQLTNWKIAIQDTQIDSTHDTGTVMAHIDEHNEAHYDIIQPVAWDFIEFRNDYVEKVSNADAFVFGSLITRNETSRNTLFQLLEIAKFKVFDVNIRPPFFSIPTINDLLAKADIVKVNKAELHMILDFLGKNYVTEDDSIHFIQDKFKISEILISKGIEGASYYNGSTHYKVSAVPINVQDTIGSGDAFLAGFLSKRIVGATPHAIMAQATALGAFITSKEGACPTYNIKDFEAFCLANNVVS
jgi:fructokinase